MKVIFFIIRMPLFDETNSKKNRNILCSLSGIRQHCRIRSQFIVASPGGAAVDDLPFSQGHVVAYRSTVSIKKTILNRVREMASGDDPKTHIDSNWRKEGWIARFSSIVDRYC